MPSGAGDVCELEQKAFEEAEQLHGVAIVPL